ncbi:MAG: arcB [Bacteroidetes bacterium]|jgi:light-regulated signal transduction histidine kinase (bacteriophytochrome)|nr:arcB [Bacteroidota bacterium]
MKTNTEIFALNVLLEKNISRMLKTNKQLVDSKNDLLSGIKKMMFMISHNIRQPVANIIGISSLIKTSKNTTEETLKLVDYLQTSAVTLDAFTKDLMTFMTNLETQENTNSSL